MQDFLKSKKIRAALWIVGGIAVFLAIFGLGIAVGSHRALFASRFGENYYHNFLRPQGFPGGGMGMGDFNTHGVAGEVIDIASSSISVKDSRGNEESIDILPETIISRDDNAISPAAIMVGNGVIVVGHPNDEGRIEARFIRVFASSSAPVPPSGQDYQEAPQPGSAY